MKRNRSDGVSASSQPLEVEIERRRLWGTSVSFCLAINSPKKAECKRRNGSVPAAYTRFCLACVSRPTTLDPLLRMAPQAAHFLCRRCSYASGCLPS
eukprot:IDg20155t1